MENAFENQLVVDDFGFQPIGPAPRNADDLLREHTQAGHYFDVIDPSVASVFRADRNPSSRVGKIHYVETYGPSPYTFLLKVVLAVISAMASCGVVILWFNHYVLVGLTCFILCMLAIVIFVPLRFDLGSFRCRLVLTLFCIAIHITFLAVCLHYIVFISNWAFRYALYPVACSWFLCGFVVSGLWSHSLVPLHEVYWNEIDGFQGPDYARDQRVSLYRTAPLLNRNSDIHCFRRVETMFKWGRWITLRRRYWVSVELWSYIHNYRNYSSALERARLVMRLNLPLAATEQVYEGTAGYAVAYNRMLELSQYSPVQTIFGPQMVKSTFFVDMPATAGM